MSSNLLTVTSKPTFRDLLGRFSKANKALLEIRRESMRLLGRRWVTIARTEAPTKTGGFRKSIGFRTYIVGNTIKMTTHSAQPLGKWIVEGTRPHIIAARRVKYLRFHWEKGPRGPGIYYFQSVRHPGTKPNPYQKRATERWKPMAGMELRRISNRYIALISGEKVQ